MSTTLTFDTLAFVEKLQTGGFTTDQAKSVAEAMKIADIATKAEIMAEIKAEAQTAEATKKLEMNSLATKIDLERIRADLKDAELRIIRWVVTLALGQAALIIGSMMRSTF